MSMGELPFPALVLRTIAEWLYNQGAELNGHVKDLYYDCADSLAALVDYWTGQDDE